jgi:hypothetical protein
VNIGNSSALGFTSNGTVLVGFTPVFTANGSFTVVAFADASGTTQFATINNNVTPNSGSAALQVFNAAAGTQPLTIAANGTALNGGTVTFGSSTNFLSVPTGAVDLTASSAGTLISDLGTFNLTAGQTQTLVIAPPAAGSTTLRTITASGC